MYCTDLYLCAFCKKSDRLDSIQVMEVSAFETKKTGEQNNTRSKVVIVSNSVLRAALSLVTSACVQCAVAFAQHSRLYYFSLRILRYCNLIKQSYSRLSVARVEEGKQNGKQNCSK